MDLGNLRDALDSFYAKTPFAPFTIRLKDGGRLQVDHDRALAVGNHGYLVHVGPGNRTSILDHHSILRLVDGLDRDEDEAPTTTDDAD